MPFSVGLAATLLSVSDFPRMACLIEPLCRSPEGTDPLGWITMTQEQNDTTLTLSDIAAEIGIALDEVETPQEQPAAEATEEPPIEAPEATDTEEPAEADLSQDTDSDEAEEATDEADSDKDDAEKEEEKAPVPEKLLKRIDKLTAKRREAEERAETLETEVSDLRAKLEASTAVQISPSPSEPLADVETSEQLDERVATAKKIRAWAIKNLEGGTVQNAAGEDVYYEPSQVRDYLATADELLTEHAPRRKEWIAHRSQVVPEAKAVYPQLFKSGTPEHDMLRQTLKAFPHLKSMPNLEMVIGDAIEGQKLRFARIEAAQKKAAAASSTESKNPAKATSAPPSPAKGAKVPAKDIETRERAKNIYSRASSLKSDDIAAFLEGAL